jgi:hypothetical protein
MRVLRWSTAGKAVGVMVLGVLMVGSARPVSAEVTGTNGCAANASFATSGLEIDAATANGVVTIPRKDTVSWQASVAAPPGAYSGSLWLELPPPFSKVELKSWHGNSQTTSNSGTDEYNIPKFIPGGAEMTLAGKHVDANGTCEGSISVKLDGSPLSSPVTWVSLGATAAAGGGLLMLLRPLFGKVM